MSHGRRPRVCPVCFGIVSQGGEFKKCSLCGWTNKPRFRTPEQLEQERRARKLQSAALMDVHRPGPRMPDHIKAKKNVPSKLAAVKKFFKPKHMTANKHDK